MLPLRTSLTITLLGGFHPSPISRPHSPFPRTLPDRALRRGSSSQGPTWGTWMNPAPRWLGRVGAEKLLAAQGSGSHTPVFLPGLLLCLTCCFASIPTCHSISSPLAHLSLQTQWALLYSADDHQNSQVCLLTEQKEMHRIRERIYGCLGEGWW